MNVSLSRHFDPARDEKIERSDVGPPPWRQAGHQPGSELFRLIDRGNPLAGLIAGSPPRWRPTRRECHASNRVLSCGDQTLSGILNPFLYPRSSSLSKRAASASPITS